MPSLFKSKNSSSSSKKSYGTCGPNDPKKSVNPTQTNTKNTVNRDGGRDNTPVSLSRSEKETKPLDFVIECSGLKPNTRHDFYYKNTKITDDCRSLMDGQKISSNELISDSSGKLKFKFQLKVKSVVTNVGAGIKSVSLQEPAGDALFEIRGENSSAKALVQFKDF